MPYHRLTKQEILDLIEEILNDMEIYPQRQVSFPDCIYKKALIFDFWLPEYNLLIEYDGEQHSDPNDYRNRKPEERQIKDGIKTDWCKENGITLLRIPYTVKDIRQFLYNYFA